MPIEIEIWNGLSYNLVRSYFSTLYYYEKGYMSDWIVNFANELGIDSLEIDILNKEIKPDKLNIRPLLIYLDDLKGTILKTLKSNDFLKEFITEAKFKISINNNREVICKNYVQDGNRKNYKTKDFKEQSYEKFETI